MVEIQNQRWHYFNQDMLDWLLEFQIFFSRVLCQFQHVYGCQVMKIWHIATCPRFSYKIWLKSKIKRWHYFNQDMLDWLSEFQIFCPESCASSSMYMDARSWKTGIEPHVLVVHPNGSYTQEKHHYDRDMMQKMKIELK